jgi:outer membrane immunogenic protein
MSRNSIKIIEMKKLFFAVGFIFITGSAFSQGSVPHGSNQLNFGVGFSGWGVPVYLGFDHGVGKDFTIGAEFSYRDYREDYRHYYYHHNIMGFSGNANYHFNRVLEMPRDWDFYAGLNLGFYVWTSPNDYPGSESSRLGLGGQIGTRYYLSHKVGLNLEFVGGNAFSGGKFGLTVKL